MTWFTVIFWGDMWCIQNRIGGLILYPGEPTREAAEAKAKEMSERCELERRKNRALDRALEMGVPDAELLRAIEEGTLLQFEDPQPLIVES